MKVLLSQRKAIKKCSKLQTGLNFSGIETNGSRAKALEPLALILEKLKPAKVKLPSSLGKYLLKHHCICLDCLDKIVVY